MRRRPFGVLEGYAIHAGGSREEVANIENTNMPEISNPRAQEHLGQYRDAFVDKNGPDIDWFRAPFDSQLMYDCTGGKPHGRFAIADGAFDSESIQLTGTTGATSEFQRAKRKREQDEIDRRLQEREREIVDRIQQRENDIIRQVREEARQEVEQAGRERDARQELQMWQMFSYFSQLSQTQPQGIVHPTMPPFNWSNFLGNAPATYQGLQNSHEATIQRNSDNSFGSSQATHNIGENSATGRTSRSENDNNGENGHGSIVGRTSGAEHSGHVDGHVDPFLEQWFGHNAI